ncbi:ketopantoate reductase family protein [Flavobacterium sp. W21_SRS_FM6]|uniref:ketopantoate reductase family protein n=1 Tax=Flavobacterium sp. W21_SRS_FM6 TaxID=3240268 RepID=UPI003F927E48
MTELNQQDKNLIIVGNGAIGNVLATRCKHLNINYGVITRKSHNIALRVSDAHLQDYTFSLPLVPVKAIEQSTLIILPIKAYQVMTFIEQAQHYFSANHTLVLLHNGMGTIERVQQQLPQVNIVAATTTYGAFKPSDDSLSIKGIGDSQLGWVKHLHCDKSAVELLLSSLLPPATWHKDIRLPLWHKLAVNAAINPLTAIDQVKNGDLIKAGYQRQIKHICEEISAVMQALKYTNESCILYDRVMQVVEQTANNYSSMNRDVMAKRKTEIDYINGYVVDRAAQFGIPCPENNRLVNEIKRIEQQY